MPGSLPFFIGVDGAGNVFAKNGREAHKWCKVATENMPTGKAKKPAENIFERLRNRVLQTSIRPPSTT